MQATGADIIGQGPGATGAAGVASVTAVGPLVNTGTATNVVLELPAGSIPNAQLQNSTVNYPAGAGLSGGGAVSLGGTATAFSIAASGVTAAVYGSATQAPVLTIGVDGRVTLASNATVTPAWGSITGTPTTLAGYGITDAVPSARQVLAGTGLTGGGALTADRTLAADFGTAAGKVAEGNDSRFPPAPAAAGRVLYDTGTAWAALAAGTAGQALLSNGAAAPSWGTPPAAPRDIVLGSMAPTGTWTNNQFVGPNYSTFSSAGATGYTGSGVQVMPAAGTLSDFLLVAASTSAYNFNVEVYVGPDPASLVGTGVYIAVTIGGLVFENAVDTIPVSKGDCVALLNTDATNTWACGAMTCRASLA